MAKKKQKSSRRARRPSRSSGRHSKQTRRARRVSIQKVAARRVRRLASLRREAVRQRRAAAGLRLHVEKVHAIQAERPGLSYREAQRVVKQRQEIGVELLGAAIFVPRDETEEFAFNFEDVIRRSYPEILPKLNATHYRAVFVAVEVEGEFSMRELGGEIEREIFFVAREGTPEAFFSAYFDALRNFRQELGAGYWIFRLKGLWYG